MERRVRDAIFCISSKYPLVPSTRGSRHKNMHKNAGTLTTVLGPAPLDLS